MSGFDKKDGLKTGVSGEHEMEAGANPAISWDEIQRRVAEAHYLRSVYFADWLKRTARSWASIFRRPGRAIPSSADKLRWQTQAR